MTLKIIGGKFKNHSINTPKGILTKPTMSMMRKSVFDICQSAITGAIFLDLFACSGAMGIEAISRGADFSYFIDKDKNAAACIKENLKKLHIEAQGKVICSDALSALSKLEKINVKFSLIYIDPPYTHLKKAGHSPKEILDFFDQTNLLSENGVLFIEEGVPATIIENQINLKKLKLKNSRKFSNSILHQFTF